MCWRPFCICLSCLITLQMMLILCLIMLNIVYMQTSVSQLDITNMLLFLPVFLLLIVCWFLKAAGAVVPCELKQLQVCTINTLKNILCQLCSLPFKELVYILMQMAIFSDQKKSLFRLTKKVHVIQNFSKACIFHPLKEELSSLQTHY